MLGGRIPRLEAENPLLQGWHTSAGICFLIKYASLELDIGEACSTNVTHQSCTPDLQMYK